MDFFCSSCERIILIIKSQAGGESTERRVGTGDLFRRAKMLKDQQKNWCKEQQDRTAHRTVQARYVSLHTVHGFVHDSLPYVVWEHENAQNGG